MKTASEKDKRKKEFYKLLCNAEKPKKHYTNIEEELKELLSTVKKISSYIEENYEAILEGSLENHCIELTNFSWANSIKFVLHSYPDGYYRKFSGKINTNEITFKEDKIVQATIDLYFPDREEEFCIQGEPIIKHFLFYLFQVNNRNNIGEDYSSKKIKEIIKTEGKKLYKDYDFLKFNELTVDNYFKLASSISFLCEKLAPKTVQNYLKNQYAHIDSYIVPNVKDSYEYTGSVSDAGEALNFLKDVIALAEKSEREECEEKIKNLIGSELESLLGISLGKNNYLYRVFKKFLPEKVDFNMRLERLDFMYEEEVKELKRSLLKDRIIIKKNRSGNGILELTSDYFYNEKNKELYEKYNESYNEMVESGVLNNFYKKLYMSKENIRIKYNRFKELSCAFFNPNHKKPVYF